MKYFQYTNIGPRSKNEDSLYAGIHFNSVFAFIADGVGGLPHGDIASKYVINEFKKNIEADKKLSFKNLLINTNSGIEHLATKELNVDFIGTTFSGLYANQKKIKGIHIGDSRVILIRNERISELTVSHNEAGRLLRENKINKKESENYNRKNILENVLGSKKYFDFMEFNIDSKSNDRIIISTDGFHESITDEIILRISNKYKSIDKVYRGLTIEIENRILKDNTSFILIEL
ncbi:PP2C family protein-serine/threonine phosphatase [Mariniflexile ostreae]|uniref:PP2C family protein-serine/threonine phosphatase n=2 Tax=Flavobacteriaceae TaxID=49546 RepID=A0ABV5FBU2_9FLAO|nr:PP2C family serine/threonine-protein phosphatase [Psychroserpens luteus]